MKILVTNDDGIFAEGIRSLTKALVDVGDVFVIAPNRQRSATGHAITMHEPLRVERVNYFELDVEAWAVSGTPSDCVKLGVEVLMKEKPDIIFSGINKGANLGTDVLYSGTVSAAIEGAMLGFPSIAVSLAAYQDLDYAFAAKFSKNLAQLLKEKHLPEETLLNVNIPNLKEEFIKGVRVSSLGVRKYKNSFIERIDPQGQSYYWMGGEILDEDNGEHTDIFSIKSGYISVTPIHFDLTRFDLLSQVEQWNIKK